MSAAPALTVQGLMRSGLVISGLLLLAVGLGDSLAGQAKVAQYQELLRTTAAPAPADPAALFPTASESSERHEIARAKLAFYHLWLTVGQLLSALGFALLALGVLRALRASPGPRPAN